jgi:DNA polymerase
MTPSDEIRDTRTLLEEKLKKPGAHSPETLLSLVRECIAHCRDCHPPHEIGPAVPGSGPASARLMIVGGTPSPEGVAEREPFVGSVRVLLEDNLRRTGLGLPDVYFTNAVKHCLQGISNGHARPAGSEGCGGAEVHQAAVEACRRLLHAEIAVVKPEVVLCLGEFAAEVVLGQDVDPEVSHQRLFHPGFVPTVLVTADPLRVLALTDESAKRCAEKEFLLDFHKVAEILGEFDPFRGREALAQL